LCITNARIDHLSSRISPDQAQGELDDAETKARRALDIFEAKFGSAHDRTAQALCTLGWIAGDRGNFSQASSFFDRAVAICSSLHDESHQMSQRMRGGKLANDARMMQAAGEAQSKVATAAQEAVRLLEAAVRPPDEIESIRALCH
jgi:hypothetical protein